MIINSRLERELGKKFYVEDEVEEPVPNRLERIIGDVCGRYDFRVTRRYSPGYCGWSVSEQKKLFSLLNAGFCGITLAESSLMVPIKSVGGIIGIGKDAKRKAYECATCDRKDCIMKKRLGRNPHRQ